MAGVKEGSVMEGIFAMYCAAYLIDPQSGRSKSKIESFINDLRVDTSLGDLLTPGKKSVDYNKTFPQHAGPAKKHFGGGNSPLSIVSGKDAKVMIKDSPKYKTLAKNLPNTEKFFESVKVAGYPDFTQVILKVRVKEAETGDYYGPNLQKLLDEEVAKGKVTSGAKYESIKQRMKFLINNKESAFFRSLKASKERYLKNKESDVIHWTVDADGIGGEVSHGDIKQDVTIRIMADGVKVLEEELNFSLKASSITIHGGGLYDTMEEVYKMFKGIIPETKRQEGVDFMKDIYNKKSDKYARKDAIDALWKLIGQSIPAQPDVSNSDYWWGVLEKRLYGSSAEYNGRIQLLEMNQKELREITKDNFLRLKRSGVKLYPQYRESAPTASSPGDIRIMPQYVNGTFESNTKNSVFQMRPSYLNSGPKDENGKRHGKGYPNKIFIELGGVNSIVHDENYQKYLDKGLV